MLKCSVIFFDKQLFSQMLLRFMVALFKNFEAEILTGQAPLLQGVLPWETQPERPY